MKLSEYIKILENMINNLGDVDIDPPELNVRILCTEPLEHIICDFNIPFSNEEIMDEIKKVNIYDQNIDFINIYSDK